MYPSYIDILGKPTCLLVLGHQANIVIDISCFIYKKDFRNIEYWGGRLNGVEDEVDDISNLCNNCSKRENKNTKICRLLGLTCREGNHDHNECKLNF